MLFRAMLKKLLLLLLWLLPAKLRIKLLAWPFRLSYLRQRKTLKFPAQVQRSALQSIVEKNRHTEFGRLHGFEQIKDLSQFTLKVPPRAYQEFEPLLERQKKGEAKVLTSEAVVGYNMARSNHHWAKSIPITPSLLDLHQLTEEYMFGLAIRTAPGVVHGSCLTVFPWFQQSAVKAGIPSAPLSVIGALSGKGARFPLALPVSFFSIAEEAVRFYLLLRLTIGKGLTILRASSPGTLIILVEYLELFSQRLLDDLFAGKIEYFEMLDEELKAALPRPRAGKALMTQLAQKLKQKGRLTPQDIWPDLQLLITSTTGHAKAAKDRLADRYGKLPVIDIGCRTEEGIFTWPWHYEPGGVPLADGQLLEFLPLDQLTMKTIELNKLHIGQRYRPVVTAPNGLYRLVTEVVVEVTGNKDQLPLLAMLGRVPSSLQLSSGELVEEQLREVMAKVSTSCDLEIADFIVCLDQLEPMQPHGQPPSAKAGWFSRLFKKNRRQAQTDEPLTSAFALCLALEPARTIEEAQAQKILQTFDRQLGAVCPAYAQERQEKALGKPLLLILKGGAFARYRRKRLADGEENAHFPEPILCKEGWTVPLEDVLFHLA